MKTFRGFVFVIVIFLVFCRSTAFGRAKLKNFKNHPLIQCSVCEAMSLTIGYRMNVTAMKHGSTGFKKAHKITEKEAEYIGSELQAVDVLEILCNDVAKDVELVEVPENHIRIVSGDKQRFQHKAHIYSKKEQGQLSNIKSRIVDFCEEVLDNHEGLLTRIIMKKRFLTEVTEGMCVYGLKLCEPKGLQDFMQQEMQKYRNFVETMENKGLPLDYYDDKVSGEQRKENEEVISDTGEM